MGTGIGIWRKAGFSLQAKVEKLAMKHPRYGRTILITESLLRRGSAGFPVLNDIFAFAAGGITVPSLEKLVECEISRIKPENIEAYLDVNDPNIKTIVRALSPKQLAAITAGKMDTIVAKYAGVMSGIQISAITSEQASNFIAVQYKAIGDRLSSQALSNKQTLSVLTKLAKHWKPRQMLSLLSFLSTTQSS